MRISSILISAAFLCATAVGVGVASQIYVDASQQQVKADVNSDTVTYSTLKIAAPNNWTENYLGIQVFDSESDEFDSAYRYTGWTYTTYGTDHFLQQFGTVSGTQQITLQIPNQATSLKAFYITGNNWDERIVVNDLSVMKALGQEGQVVTLSITAYNETTHDFDYRWEVESARTPSPETLRVWFKPDYTQIGSNYLYTFHYWGDGIDVEILPTENIVYRNDGVYQNTLSCYDLPFDVIGNSFQFKCYEIGESGSYGTVFDSLLSNHSTNQLDENSQLENSFTSGLNSWVFYEHSGDSGNRNCHRGSLDSSDSNTNWSVLVPKVLEAYYTCRDNVDNGYLIIDEVHTRVLGGVELDDNWIVEDYGSMDTSYSGGRVAKAGSLTKFNRMMDLLAETRTSPETALAHFETDSLLYGSIIASSAVLLGGISVLAIRRKRRASR